MYEIVVCVNAMTIGNGQSITKSGSIKSNVWTNANKKDDKYLFSVRLAVCLGAESNTHR